jgi:hypothetical protein
MSQFNLGLFMGGMDLVPDILNGDANADLTGDWINLKNYDRAYLVLMKPAGTAGDDLSIRLQQASDNAGTGAKALEFSRLWHKIGTMSALPTWTKIDLTTATDDLDLVLVNSVDLETDVSAAVIIVEVLAESLDANNGFDHVNVIYEGDDIGNALVINSFWLLEGNKVAQSIPLSPLG